MTAYYNEFDPKAAAWLRELVAGGLIADGVVDERSILDVQAEDVRGFTQCHWFAGIGGWSYSLRLAGVPDDCEVWTGSPPCQPFSTAGLQKGKDDARHLAPKFASLVRAARPALLFGEQVAGAAVFGPAPKGNRPGFEGTPPWTWLDDLSDRLEAARYAVWANDVPAAGVGGPHIRQRTFFGAARLADADQQQRDWRGDVGARGRGKLTDLSTVGSVEHATSDGRLERRAGADGRGAASGRGLGGLANRDDAGLEGRGQPGRERAAERLAGPDGVAGGLADTDGRDASAEREQPGGQQRQQPQDGGVGGLGYAASAGPLPGPHAGIHRGQEGAGPRDAEPERSSDAGGLADAELPRGAPRGPGFVGASPEQADGRGAASLDAGVCGVAARSPEPGPVNGVWRDADWLFCRDGKWRPVEPGTFPLVAGLPGRVGLLRGYGNAIVPEAAQAFIEASLEALADIERVRLTTLSRMTTDNHEGVFG